MKKIIKSFGFRLILFRAIKIAFMLLVIFLVEQIPQKFDLYTKLTLAGIVALAIFDRAVSELYDQKL